MALNSSKILQVAITEKSTNRVIILHFRMMMVTPAGKVSLIFFEKLIIHNFSVEYEKQNQDENSFDLNTPLVQDITQDPLKHFFNN